MSAAFLPLSSLIPVEVACADPDPKGIGKKPEKKSNHRVDMVRIPAIEKHPNADTLGIVRIRGYQVIVKLGEFNEGDLSAYIQPDSVVPPEDEFAFLWSAQGYKDGDDIPLKYRRITVRKFRKEYSEGLLIRIPEWVRIDDGAQVREPIEGDDVSDALGITHYEPPEPQERAVNQRNPRPRSLKGWFYWFLERIGIRVNGNTGGRNIHGPSSGRPVYDVEAFKNYPNVFTEGEPVVVTEKIHGSNARYTYQDGKMHVGSRTMWKNPEAKCVWVDALKQNPAIGEWCQRNPGFTLYGEVVPTQGSEFMYGCLPGQVRFFLFDILRPDNEWEPIDKVLRINESLGVFHVS